MAISFHNADLKFVLKNKRELKLFLSDMIKRAGQKPGDLSFVFCTDNYLLDINQRFLNHDYYTDIITFPMNEQVGQIAGEIYISVDRVKENAVRFGKPGTAKGKAPLPASEKDIYRELHRVIFHGVLHLLGYKDKSRTHQAEMRKMEDQWIKKYSEFLKKNTSG